MEILTSLKQFDFISGVEVLLFDKRNNAYHLKMMITLTNGDSIYSNEFVGEHERKYAYHWQNKNGELRVRWDNAPHHSQLITFPFHAHTPNGVEESLEMNLLDVLKYIKRIQG